MKIRLLPAAERDLEIGADFYESQKAGLGVYFSDCLASDIESLKLHAGIHEQYRRFHRALSKRFPFAIYYKVNADWADIYAILDARQDPQKIDAALESTTNNAIQRSGE
jgi:plasmid stabilization system protein ParE